MTFPTVKRSLRLEEPTCRRQKHYMWAGGKVGVDNHWLEGTLGAELARPGQVEDGGGRETVLQT